jgi:hypothetical protein
VITMRETGDHYGAKRVITMARDTQKAKPAK